MTAAANPIDFAIQAEMHGLANLPPGWWDWPRERRVAEAERVATAIVANPQKHRGFLERYGHFLPASLAASIDMESRRPVGVTASSTSPEVLILYRQPSQKMIGLGVNASLSVEVLRAHGMSADVFGITCAAEIRGLLAVQPKARFVMIEGVWIVTPDELAEIADEYPAVKFLVRSHSQIAFLQIEPAFLANMRKMAELAHVRPNLFPAGNSPRFTEWAAEAWGVPVAMLPNLYVLPPWEPRSTMPLAEARDSGRPLRLASFGATRLQKHHGVAAAAAVTIARRTGLAVEFHVNVGRNEAGGNSVLAFLRAMLAGQENVTLVENPWMPAAEFRELIASMDLCFQLSATETFNIVTADAAAAGVPSVVSEAIEWAPADWRAPIDDPLAAAEVAMRLLADNEAGIQGRAALERNQREAVAAWLSFVQSGLMTSTPVTQISRSPN